MRIPLVSSLLESWRSSVTHAEIERLRGEAALDRRRRGRSVARLEAMEARLAEGMTQHLVEWSAGSLEYGGGEGERLNAPTVRNLDQSRNDSRVLCGTSPTAIGLIERACDFALGWQGLTLTVKFEEGEPDPEVDGRPFSKLIIREWRRWKRAVGWHKKVAEAFTRLLRDGEQVQRWFDRGPSDLAVRFVDPERIPSNGILTEPGDAETLVGLRIRADVSSALEETVPAAELTFGKIGADGNQPRGVPWLHQSAHDIRYFDALVYDLSMLVHIRTAIALIQEHKGTPGQARAFADAQKTGTTSVIDGGVSRDIRRQTIRGGTILNTTQGTTLKYLEPNIDIGKLDGFAKLIALRIAQRTGLPLHLCWMEAHSATLAGILVAETPGLKTIERLQGTAEDEIERPAWRHWLRWMYRWQTLPKTWEELDEAATFQGPRYPRRERLDEVNADSRLYRDGAMSMRTYRIRDNLDPDEEERRCAEEEKTQGPYGGGEEDEDEAGREARRARMDAGADAGDAE